MDRRRFVKNTLIGSMAVSAAPAFSLSNHSNPPARNYKIGIMWGTIGTGKTISEKFQHAKEAGFNGVQVNSHLDRNEVVRASKATGLPVSSVCDAKHWESLLSSPDKAVRDKGREALELSLEDAKFYGTDTVLLVPGKVDESVSYDDCWNRTTEEIKKVVPLAEKLKVNIAIENVWNNFLLSPVEAIHYMDQFRSEYVKFFFDCGNIMVYGWPEQWIKILGKRIARVHIKEFDMEAANSQGKRAGFNVDLGEGSVNWSAVMKALDNTGYKSWLTLEQRGGGTPEGLKDLVERTKKIIKS
ncbi:MAG: sugar phosphate isomerase/epimerase [Prolixibacteraceae bacterium]|jgi:hexulose-6-phosphate isomerase|nr:sugar phosphate isomerase/epimerase [Prolixibacteraceae bacterium]NLO01666.1 sugar phosphate isomerase/epimerase [Bacteroidales bacterium]